MQVLATFLRLSSHHFRKNLRACWQASRARFLTKSRHGFRGESWHGIRAKFGHVFRAPDQEMVTFLTYSQFWARFPCQFLARFPCPFWARFSAQSRARFLSLILARLLLSIRFAMKLYAVPNWNRWLAWGYMSDHFFALIFFTFSIAKWC